MTAGFRLIFFVANLLTDNYFERYGFMAYSVYYCEYIIIIIIVTSYT